MEEEKTFSITTSININDILNKTINNVPQTECDFNNSLIFNFTDVFLDKLQMQLQQQRGGKRKKRKTKMRRNLKYKKTRKLRSQKGGTNPLIVFFFISMFFVFAKGVQNMTDTDVIKRIKQANEVSDVFRNYYGTCTLNTLLFLKTISIPTFEELTLDMMVRKPGLTSTQMSQYLNKELNFHSKWYSFSGREGELEEVITLFIDRIRTKLISLRAVYGFGENQSIITAMNYIKRGKDVGHSVIIWLTSKNEVVLIEPQKFLRNDIILYTTDIVRYMYDDKQLKTQQLRSYIRENIDVTNENRETDIFVSLHIEIDDTNGDNSLSPLNNKLIETITRIRSVEEDLQDKDAKRVEEL